MVSVRRYQYWRQYRLLSPAEDAVNVLGPERKLLTTEASGRLMTFVTLSASLIFKALHHRHAGRDAAADRAFAGHGGHGNERYGALHLRWTETRAHKHSSMQLSAGWGRGINAML